MNYLEILPRPLHRMVVVLWGTPEELAGIKESWWKENCRAAVAKSYRKAHVSGCAFKPKDGPFFAWLRDKPKGGRDLETLHHELMHVVDLAYPNNEKDDVMEKRAELLEWLMRDTHWYFLELWK